MKTKEEIVREREESLEIGRAVIPLKELFEKRIRNKNLTEQKIISYDFLTEVELMMSFAKIQEGSRQVKEKREYENGNRTH